MRVRINMSNLSDAESEVLYEHYKETCEIIRDSIGVRDKWFFLILILAAVFLFEMFSPEEAMLALSNIISSKLQLHQQLNMSFVRSILWFSLLAITMKYCQTVVYIEKQYKYVHNLEDRINKSFGSCFFTREGKSYSSNFPLFFNFSWILYTWIFPVLYLTVVVSKIINEWQRADVNSVLIWTNSIFTASIIILVVFYLFQIHGKNNQKTACHQGPDK